MRSRKPRDYFEWLCDYISVPGIRTEDYSSVLKLMYTIPFEATNPRDVNRSKDALYLRNEYLVEMGKKDYPPVTDRDDASVFEVLAALSIRCERDIIGEPGDELWGRLFWEMLHNLKINMTNRDFNEPICVKNIERWINRGYRSDGVGGIFPLRKKQQIDQTEAEIWYQMQSYISENF